MRWQDIDPRYPDRDGSTLDKLLTHGARLALGFDAAPRDRKDALRRISDAIIHGWAHRDDHESKGALALLAALEGEWDLVGDCTGSALPGRVVIKKTYDANLVGLARHLAVVARSKLPARHAYAAIAAARDRFRADATPPDPRAIVLATQLFVRDIARQDDPTAAARAWLDGEHLALDTARTISAPADGEDPRVKIFERYLSELSNEDEITALLGKHAEGFSEPWARDLEQGRAPLDDLVVRAYVARVPLFDGWERLVDPVVAAWLDASPPNADARFRDLALLRPADAIRGEWSDAIFAVVSGTAPAFQQLVDAGKLPKWRPGQFFKDDARKLLRYVASAIAVGAPEDAVLPAWHDFLSRRSPVTTPRLTDERVPLRWKHLLAIQVAISHRLGGKPRGESGRCLQQVVTGA